MPYLLGLFVLYTQSNFNELLSINLVVQSILFFIVVCIPIYRTQRMSYVDIAWPWGLVLLGLVNYFYNDGSEIRVLIASIIVSIIGLRMGIGALGLWKQGYLNKELSRYEYQRIVWKKEGKTNTQLALQIDAITQGLANATFLAVPIFLSGSSGSNTFTVIEYLGLFIWLISIILESIADSQKIKFLRTKKKEGLKNQVCDVGLWKYSRHPNYFFEWMVWNGVILYSVPSLLNSQTISEINMILIAGCLLYASKLMYDTLVYKTGAVPSEYFSLKKRPGYKEYQEKTSQFFPRFK